MVCKEEITLWFKGLEGDQRVDLMCNLLDCCLPLELRFLGTYIEFAASKHYGNLQKYEKTANEATFGELRDLYDATIRRKFCIYLALLYSHNKKAATDLFQFLEHFQLTGDKSKEKEDNLTVNGIISGDEETCINEIKLLLSMASFHPAFTFNQKQILRNKLVSWWMMRSVSYLSGHINPIVPPVTPSPATPYPFMYGFPGCLLLFVGNNLSTVMKRQSIRNCVDKQEPKSVFHRKLESFRPCSVRQNVARNKPDQKGSYLKAWCDRKPLLPTPGARFGVAFTHNFENKLSMQRIIGSLMWEQKMYF